MVAGVQNSIARAILGDRRMCPRCSSPHNILATEDLDVSPRWAPISRNAGIVPFEA